MALVQFYRGLKEKYNSSTFADGLYFAMDTGEIIMNDKVYGYNSAAHREVETVDYQEPNVIAITYTNGESDVITLVEAEAGDSIEDSTAGLMSAADVYKLSKIEDGAEKNIINSITVDGEEVEVTEDGEAKIDLSELKAEVLGKTVKAADASVTVTPETDGSGVKVGVQLAEDGGIDLTDEGLAVDPKAFVEYEGDAPIEVSAEVDGKKKVSLKLNTAEGNIITKSADGLFATVKLKSVEVPTEEQYLYAAKYKLVGLNPAGDEISVGDLMIQIPKGEKLVDITVAEDFSNITVSMVGESGPYTKTINLNDIFTAKTGDGLQFADGKMAVKIDTAANEKDSSLAAYLQVTEAGLKLVGINAELAKAKTEVDAKTAGHVKVAVVTEADGHAHVTVTEDDIASASDVEELAGTVTKNKVKSVDNSMNVVEKTDGTEISVKIKSNAGLSVTDDGLAVDENALTAIEAGDGLDDSKEGRIQTLRVKAANESIVVTEDGVKANLQVVLDDTGKADTVLHQYKLTDGTNSYGVAIEIPKDKNLMKAYMGHADDSLASSASPEVTSGTGEVALCLVYQIADGSYNLAAIPASSFFTEQAFKDGLQVIDGVVTVKLAEGNESQFLTVTEAGVKLSGVAKAIQDAVKGSSVVINEVSTGHIRVSKEGNEVDGYTYTISEYDIASAAYLTALATKVSAVTGFAGETYVADEDATYISEATSLHDADKKLDTAIAALEASLTWYEAE